MRHNFSKILPSSNWRRTLMDLSHDIKTTMSVGKLYPLDIVEVLPGDTVKCKVANVSRVSTAFLKPVMDNLFMDIYHFYVPLRQLMDDSDKIFGNANPSQYQTNGLYTIPTIALTQTVTEGTVADYLGLPLGSVNPGLSVFPFRAFAKIWNEWFRNENIESETYIQRGRGWSPSTESINNNVWSPTNYMGQLPYVAKIKDIFTSCLPAPQKGATVNASLAGLAPVITQTSSHNPGSVALRFRSPNGTVDQTSITSLGITNSGGFAGVSGSAGGSVNLAPSNLYADLSAASGFSINDLRFAFQLQKILELDARAGSRINSYYRSFYGVDNPDLRIQFTKYIGGGRIPISVQQVAQTSQGTEDSALGEVGAFSLSNGFSKFSDAITEHGYIITVGCIRQIHSYSQGIQKMWFRKERNDFFNPLFAHLGEQPIYREQLFASNAPAKETIFGYNEYGVEYRYLENRTTGQMRPKNSKTLGIWAFTDNYTSAPTLSTDFIHETPINVDNALAVPSASQDQFICDLYFKMSAIRVMPLYSTPGYIDH